MTNPTETASAPATGSTARSTDRQEDPQSPSTPAAEAAGDRRSLVDRLLGYFRQRNGTNLREEIVDALAEDAGGASDMFSPGERAMLNNILRLREVRVEDVMIPRADVQAIDIGTSLAELMTVFEQSGHSRMPVYAETLDDPRGMVHIRDVLGYITRSARVRKPRQRKADTASSALDFSQVDLNRTIGELELIRTVLFVPPSMLASELMARMQATRTQMALVIDEYGGTDGLVSLEDIVEMVVGDIEDEHDEDIPLITKAGDGVFVVDAKAEIEDVAKAIGQDFHAGEHGEYVDTIGGLLFNALGRVPTRGEVVQAVPGFEFHVLDADPRRVKRVRIVHDPRGEKRRRTMRNATEEAPNEGA